MMKTAISLPDELFDRVNRSAKRLGISRSEFFARAVARYIETARQAEIKASYDAAFGEEDSDAAEVVRQAARKALLSVEWDDR